MSIPSKKYIKYLILNALQEKLLFQLKKVHYVRSLRSFSENDVDVVKSLVNPGEYVIDIGAHVGWYTKVLSEQVGENGQVYSIEPIPITFELLSFCVKKLKLRNVRLLNCGISEKDGSALMEIPQYRTGGENFYQARIVNEEMIDQSFKHYEIDLKSIDSLFLSLSDRITFIKCDVEGHEFSVIRGAAKFLANSKPAWLVEVSGNPDDHYSEYHALFEYLTRRGYTAYWYDGESLRERSLGVKSINYFFLTPYHLNIFKASRMRISYK